VDICFGRHAGRPRKAGGQVSVADTAGEPIQIEREYGVLAMSLSASWQIAYGPYVADYSRYLPRDTSVVRVF